MTYTLAQLPPGESGCVAALDFPPRKARRMEDLGFLPGQQVTALHTPPFGGITAYQVLDTVIALRDTDASRSGKGGSKRRSRPNSVFITQSFSMQS